MDTPQPTFFWSIAPLRCHCHLAGKFHTHLTCSGQRGDGTQGERPVETSRKRGRRSPAWRPEELLVCQLENTGRCWDKERRSRGREASPSAVGKQSNRIPGEVPANDRHDRHLATSMFQELPLSVLTREPERNNLNKMEKNLCFFWTRTMVLIVALEYKHLLCYQVCTNFSVQECKIKNA